MKLSITKICLQGLLINLFCFSNHYCDVSRINQAGAYSIEQIITTDDCVIAFVNDTATRKQYVVKQIKDPRPDEQFLLVIDATACNLAQRLNISLNHVEIYPAHSPIAHIMNDNCPATLHTRVPGNSLESLPDQHIDIHQRRLRKSGLTLTVIQSMATHPQLPCIVAFDTFVGNADRSAPNIFYDSATDKFYGIDLSASWRTPLGEYALERLHELYDQGHVFSPAERQALKIYTVTLERLLEAFLPADTTTLLQQFASQAGFIPGSSLYDQDVQERICFHSTMITKNYKACCELVQFLHSKGF